MKKTIIGFVGILAISIACSKEEIKQEVVDRINATAVLTATIDSVEVSFPGSTFGYEEKTNTLTMVGSGLEGQSINISCFASQEGELVDKVDQEAIYTHAVNTTETYSNATKGHFTLTKWDVTNNLISGTFHFTYFNGTDSVYVTNGVFSDLGK